MKYRLDPLSPTGLSPDEPEGFRPSATLTFPVRSNNAFGYAEVYPDGRVVASAGNNAHFGLDGLIFFAER